MALQGKVYGFEKLIGWQHARKVAVFIYGVTQKFPDGEKFGLVSQMRRASVSIASNLAEGTSRVTGKDQAHFSTIAYSSTIELLNHLIISKDLKFLSETDYEEGRMLIEYQTLLIFNLRNRSEIS